MVIVKSAVLRTGKDEKTFVALELMGDIELVQSQNTGVFMLRPDAVSFQAHLMSKRPKSLLEENYLGEFLGRKPILMSLLFLKQKKKLF